MTNSAPSDGSDTQNTQKDQPHSEGKWGAIQKWIENNWSQVLFFVGGLAVYLLLGFLLWWLLQRYVDPNAIKDPSREATAKKDLLQALGLIMAGVAGAIGIYFTWRGQRLTQEAQEENQRNTQKQLANAQEQLNLARLSQEENQKSTQAQLENAREELRLTRQGQITERFTRAIDQLGNSSREIRLGGIYALERISKESDEDYWPIMEVLTAYVRQHACRLPEQGDQAGQDPTPPAPDIQAILSVLRRRAYSFGHGETERLDLHETDLQGANLWGANLRGANLVEANLRGANRTGADLRRAHLRSANLWVADLSKANLRGGNLVRTNLWGANLWGADLSDAESRSADLSKANLTAANLSGAVLVDVNLSGAVLVDAKLSGANLVRTNLSKAQLEVATGDENTRLPFGLKPPVHWGVKADEQSKGA